MITLATAVSPPTIAVGDTITWNGSKVAVTGSFSTTGIIAAPKLNYSTIGKTMQIYTLQGKLIAQNKIESESYFDGKSDLYKNISKGVYIVRIPTGNAVISRRVLVE
jgi:hypothetical protein